MFDKKFTDGEMCPLLKDSCARHACAWFTKVMGTDPQTGNPLEKWGCAVAWLPILTVENSQQQRHTAASVDKVANQIQRSRSEFLGALPEDARERLLQNDIQVVDKGAGPTPTLFSRK